MILKSVTTHSPEIPDDYFGRFDPSARIFKLRSIGKFRLRQPTFLRGITAELKVLHDYLFCDAEHRGIRPILFESFAQQQSLTFGHCNYRIAVYRPVSFTGNEILQFYAGCPDCHLAVTVSPDDKPLSGTVADCGTADPRNQTDLCKKSPQQLNRQNGETAPQVESPVRLTQQTARQSGGLHDSQNFSAGPGQNRRVNRIAVLHGSQAVR